MMILCIWGRLTVMLGSKVKRNVWRGASKWVEEYVQKALGPWISLEGRPREVLKQPPLALVICQIQYNQKIRVNVSDSGTAGAFQDKIDSKYPLFEQLETQRFQISGVGGRLPETQTSEPLKVFQFSDPKRDWTVSLSAEAISLECRAYPDFSEFLARMEEILTACVETVRPTIVQRIGFRYVNEIRLDSAAEAAMYVRPEMLGPLASPPFAEQTHTVTQSFELGTSGPAQINFTHGYFPRGTTVQPRSDDDRVEKGFYLIDVDVYKAFETSEPTAMNVKPILDHVLQFHDTAAKFFWWAATDHLIAQCREGSV